MERGTELKVTTETVFYFGEDWVRDYTTHRLGEHILKGKHITALVKDCYDRLWIGTSTSGVCRTGEAFREISPVLNNGFKRINDLKLDDYHGRFFVATNKGLALCNGGAHKLFNQRNGLADNRITHLQQIDAGLLLSTERGYSILDLETFHCDSGLKEVSNYHVYCSELFNGLICIGTFYGLKIIDGDVTKTFDTGNSALTNNWVSALHVHDHRIYIGTYGGGVAVVDSNGVWNTLNGSIGHCEVNFNAISSNKDHVFIGTLAHGLFVYEPATHTAKRFSQGLPSPNVTAVTSDDNYVFIGTENGLARVPLAGLV